MESIKLMNGEVVQLPVSETEDRKRYECTSRQQALAVSMALMVAGKIGQSICKGNEYAVIIKKA